MVMNLHGWLFRELVMVEGVALVLGCEILF